MANELKPRILSFPIEGDGAGETIKEYLKRRIGFSSKQLSRLKYRKNGIMVNGERRYVNYILKAGDLLEISLTRGGEPVEHPEVCLENNVFSDKKERLSVGTEGSVQACPDWLRADEGVEKDSGGRECSVGEGSANREGYLAARDGRLQKIWAAPVAWLAENYPLRILYEDQDILAADKPSGVVCHPSPGHFDDTLSNQVAEHLGRVGQELDVRVTGRLDKDTSGIVIFALNTEAAAQLIKQRQASMMSKLYIARVRGHFSKREGSNPQGSAPIFCGTVDRPLRREKSNPQGAAPAFSGTVDRPLRRESPDSFRMVTAEDGKAARTHFSVLMEVEDGTSLVACRIEHGRTHQIRVHMASIGHPLVGDRLYGPEAENYFLKKRSFDEPEKCGAENARYPEIDGRAEKTRLPEFPEIPLMLHAFRAELVQPFTGEKIAIEAPLPVWAEPVQAEFSSDVCYNIREKAD